MPKGLIINTLPLDVYEQMATDEHFCEKMPEKYILRFFNWKTQAITFGFSQKFSQVKSQISKEDSKLEITRRPTGGGIVFHKNDLTFSFIFYNPGEFNPYVVYEKLHSSIAENFEKKSLKLDILNSKTPDYSPNNPIMDCFSKPVEKDLLINGKKVLGGALRKFSDFMLYQASLQIENVRSERAVYEKIITQALGKTYDIDFEEAQLKKQDFENAGKIAYNKYVSDSWIKRI